MTRCKWTNLSLLGALAMLALVSAPKASGVERDGFIFGIGIGGGTLKCDGCDTLGAVTGSGHVGFMLTPRVALLADGWVVSHEEDLGGRDGRQELNAYTFVGAAQIWPVERLWLRGGLGVGQTDAKAGRIAYEGEEHFAWELAAGVEVLQRRRFVLDLSARVSTLDLPGRDERRTAFQIGANWY